MKLARFSLGPRTVAGSERRSDGDPLRAGFWPYLTPAAALRLRSARERGRRRHRTPGFDPTHYLYERYADTGGGGRHPQALLRGATGPSTRARNSRCDALYSHRQRARSFPRWPAEPLLVDRQYDHLRAQLRATEPEAPSVRQLLARPQPLLRGAAPTTSRAPPASREIPRILEVEQRHGFRSSWNFVAEDYRIPEGTFDEIRAAGGEVGLHGITHDGKLFTSRSAFEADLPKIHRYLADWKAAGFRSPATHGTPTGCRKSAARTTAPSRTPIRSSHRRAAAARSSRTSSATWSSFRSRSSRTTRSSRSCVSTPSRAGSRRASGSWSTMGS